MKAIKYFTCFLFLLSLTEILPQDQKILIFDPNGVSSAFQYSFSQLSDDSVFVVDTIDDSIFNFDALFLFIDYPYVLSQEESNKLIEYTSGRKPVYIYSELYAQPPDTLAFWNHIGIEEFYCLLISVLIDSVTGVDGYFTNGLVIDTSFFSGCIPVIFGNVDSVLIGIAEGWEVNTTFISEYDSLNVIIDLYNLIHHPEFLERVIEHFGLNQVNANIQFFPPVDTALVQGGCTTPEFICKNLSSTNERDSISIEPGFNTFFYYLDSSGFQVPLDNYYFIIIDSLNEYEYELWYHPKTYPPFDPILILFDSTFYSGQNDFDIQLIVKKNGVQIDSFTQPFHADFGLSAEGEEGIPNSFSLSQNYPNPFNPITTIKFTIPNTPLSFGEGLGVRLIVYDILGNEITTLVNEEKQPGTYEVEFNSVGTSRDLSLPSGIYFYQLRAGSYVETKKMVIVK